LHHHLGSELLKEFIGLTQQLCDFGLFLFLDQQDIALHVLSLQFFQTSDLLFFLKLLLLLPLGLDQPLDLVGKLFSVFDLLSMPFHKLLSVDLEVLHALFVHHPFPLIIVISEMVGLLVLAGALVFDQSLPPEEGPIQQGVLIEVEGTVFPLHAFGYFLEDALIEIPIGYELGLNL
jgi:hypothetical protein